MAAADRLLLTKCDLASPMQLDDVSRLLHGLNPGAVQFEVRRGEVAAASVLNAGPPREAAGTGELVTWLAVERVRDNTFRRRIRYDDGARHDPAVSTFVLEFDKPFDWFDFAEALDILLATCGAQVLRVKGLLALNGDERPCIVHCVQHVRYPSTRLSSWPADGPFADRRSRLVFIVHDLSRDIGESAFRMFCSAKPIDDEYGGVPAETGMSSG